MNFWLLKRKVYKNALHFKERISKDPEDILYLQKLLVFEYKPVKTLDHVQDLWKDSKSRDIFFLKEVILNTIIASIKRWTFEEC